MSTPDIIQVEEGNEPCTTPASTKCSKISDARNSSPSPVLQLLQKAIAEVIGTYFLIFTGCGSVAVNKIYGSVTFPGICVVPIYIVAQLLGSVLASGSLYLIFDVKDEAFFGTIPVGTNVQSFVLEIIISFLLMFVISGVATDNRSIGELAGIAIGMTILLNVLVAGPVSGASMNPARSLGPAIVMHQYKGLWVYIAGPIIGTILGGLAYNMIRFTDKPLREITKSGSFLKSFSRPP
ncbi:putative aquaporin NIP4-2 [Citrus sinensis]|nr:putative aquaporin NIP4-2 [Citrus sinensis]